MSRPHRRLSTEFKLQLVQSYLDGEGSVKGIASRHGIGHSLLLLWIDKYRRGELDRIPGRAHLEQRLSRRLRELQPPQRRTLLHSLPTPHKSCLRPQR